MQISSRISSGLSAIPSPIWVGVGQSVKWLARGWTSGVRSPAKSRIFLSVLYSCYIGFGAVSGYRRFSPGIERAQCKVHFPRLVPRLKNMQSFTATSLDLHVPHACPHGITRLPLDGFSWSLIFEYFSKISRENSSFVKNLTRITGTLCEDRYTFLITSRSVLLKIKTFQAKVVEKKKPYILCSTTFFRIWDNVEKYCTAG
jgi:hypothetical protein